jgi:hypothetical protein
MEFRSTPVNYLGKKAKYVGLFQALGLHQARRFGDFTSGSGTVPLFAVEGLGARDLLLNDASPYARMIAEAFFVRRPLSERSLRIAALTRPVEGYLCSLKAAGDRAWKRLPESAAAWVDGYCVGNAEQPLLLLALACVLTRGASRFSMLVGLHLESLTPRLLREQVTQAALALRPRQYGSLVSASVLDCDYLAPPLREWDLDGRVMYLDPAWPTQPGHPTVDNGRAYGLYASLVMSVLAQRALPVPAAYAVSEQDFYRGLRATVEGCLGAGARIFVAYQTTPERLPTIRQHLFAGLRVAEAFAEKNAASTLCEYLFEVGP